MLLRLVAVVVALFELLAPRRTVDLWMSLAATDGEDVELRPWVYTAARVEGAVLLLWALRPRGSGDEDDPAGD